MYFDAKAITQLILDPQAAATAAPAIAALRKRFTSPLAVVEAILVLGDGQNGADAEQQVQAFLDEADIEARDMPPANKLIAAAVKAGGGDTVAVLDAACAEYYEVAPFSLADALAAPLPVVVDEAAHAVVESPAPMPVKPRPTDS
ncbi:MAG: hypothetical protein U1E41_13345 [Paracoccus sp. (in: a-proteobacteria)]|jgi:uncharacterized protein with PIN domain